MKVKVMVFLAVFLIVLSAIVIAVEFSPQGNINMKNRYNLTNTTMGNCSTGIVKGLDASGAWVCQSESWINESGDSWSGNMNASGYNITSIDCITFISGGKICTG